MFQIFSADICWINIYIYHDIKCTSRLVYVYDICTVPRMYLCPSYSYDAEQITFTLKSLNRMVLIIYTQGFLWSLNLISKYYT